MRFTPWVVSEHVPDFSTLENIVGSPRFAGLQDEALAVALWGLLVDRELGLFHYCPAQEALWRKDAHDPLAVFNVYGFTICHVHAHILAMLARAAGLPARIANISGHEGTEIFYGGAWHYFDANVQYFHRRREPPYEIASREDLVRDPSLVDAQPRPSNPYGFPDRLPEDFRKLYESPPEYPELLEEKIHALDFVLRPGEELVRYFHHRGRWHVFESYPDQFRRFRAETGPEGPTERFWPRRQWGNSFWSYAPRLHPDYRDAELGADRLSGLALRAAGLVCEAASGEAVFAFESPYLFCGLPDPLKRVPSAEGATLQARFRLPPGGAARIEASAYVPGQPDARECLWQSGGQSGEIETKMDFTALVDGRFRANLSFVLEGRGSALSAFETRLWCMCSPHALPALRKAGPNRMSLHSGDRYGLNTRSILVERLLTAPESTSRASVENLRYEPASYSILLPQDGSRPWRFTNELPAPNGGRVAWVGVYALFEAIKPGESYDGTPAKIEIADSLEGPWTTLAERPLATHPQGWHFGVFGAGRLSGASETAYVRFSSKKGMKGFRVAVHYLPNRVPPPGTPLEIEHAWYEDDPRVGRRLRTHLERTAQLAHEYSVRCAQEPHNERLTLRVPSLAR